MSQVVVAPLPVTQYLIPSDGNGRIDKSELQLVLKVASQAVKRLTDDEWDGPPEGANSGNYKLSYVSTPKTEPK